MNISYNWLKHLIDIDMPADELAAVLTRVGLAVEGVHAFRDDLVLDIDLTSNRPDCLSHLGIAREIAAITGRKLKLETAENDPETAEVPYPAVLAPDIVMVEDPDLCYRFTARIVRNVKVAPSPKILVDRLEALGERAINNIADITNYVMLELGQPMHAFDLDKLAQNRIVVRRARTGENITTLDEVERKLDTTMLAICDAEKPVAIGGVMGGLDSSITEATTNVLLEVAYFDRASIRSTSRKLNLSSEASYRFERGVDVNNLTRASNRAVELITKLAGGEAGEFIDVYPNPVVPREIEVVDLPGETARLTGLHVSEEDCRRILSDLGIRPGNEETGRETIYISPSWRHDLSIEEDLVEEVARHVGYEKIENALPPAFGAGEYQPTEGRKRILRQKLADLGFDEAISYAFIDESSDAVFETVPTLHAGNEAREFVTLRDAVIEGAVRMRPTLLPGLLNAVRLNFNHQRRDLCLFEIGRVFAAIPSETDLPTEREILSLVVTGGELLEDRAQAVRPLDFYDAKGALEAALDAVGAGDAAFEAADVRHLKKGQSAVVSLNGKPVGSIGRLSDEIAGSYKFRQPVYVAEVDLQAVLESPAAVSVYRPLEKFPSVVRDVSFLVDGGTSFDSLRGSILEQRNELLRGVDFVDVYTGKGLEAGQRSLTLRLEYRSGERTLTDEDADRSHESVIKGVETELGIRPRS
jgi:phenylalanyl-tRNA synthetase beta chain